MGYVCHNWVILYMASTSHHACNGPDAQSCCITGMLPHLDVSLVIAGVWRDMVQLQFTLNSRHEAPDT